MADGFTMRNAPAAEKRPLFRPLPPRTRIPGPGTRAAARRGRGNPDADAGAIGDLRELGPGRRVLAVQAQRDVELPGGGRKPLTELFVSVADSGERKTSVDKLALAPVHRMEEAWRGDHAAEVQRYVNDKEAWKEARDTAKKKVKGDRAAIRAALGSHRP